MEMILIIKSQGAPEMNRLLVYSSCLIFMAEVLVQ
jgi:hypothetical protein